MDKDIIDAVCIATPDRIHREMVVDFLNAGINVLCEKPLALNSDDCRKMLDAESKSSAKLMVGQVCRKTPGFIKAKEITPCAQLYMEQKALSLQITPTPHIVSGGV